MANSNSKVTQVDLIKGTFQPQEAKEILMTLLNDKINFHQRNNWSKRERFGSQDPREKKRISELNKAKSDIQSLITMANEHGYTINLTSVIDISFEPCESS